MIPFRMKLQLPCFQSYPDCGNRIDSNAILFYRPRQWTSSNEMNILNDNQFVHNDRFCGQLTTYYMARRLCTFVNIYIFQLRWNCNEICLSMSADRLDARKWAWKSNRICMEMKKSYKSNFGGFQENKFYSFFLRR